MFNISFTNDQLQTLNDALIELPFKKAQPLIQHINAEIQKAFDSKVDASDTPTGQLNQPDQYAGD